MKAEKDTNDIVTSVADKIGQIVKLMTNLEQSAAIINSREYKEIKKSFHEFQRSLNMVEADDTKTQKSNRQSQRLSISTNPLNNIITKLETLQVQQEEEKQKATQNSRASQAVESSRRHSIAAPFRRRSNAPLPQAYSQPASPQLPIKDKRLNNLLKEEGIQPRRSSVSENKSAVQPASSPPVTEKSDWQRKRVSESAAAKVEDEKQKVNAASEAQLEARANELTDKIFDAEPTAAELDAAEKPLAAAEEKLDAQVKELTDQIFDAEPTAAELDAAEKQLAAAEEKLDAQVKELTDQIFDAEPTAAELDAAEKKLTESHQQGVSQEQGVKASQGSPVQKGPTRSAASPGQQSQAAANPVPPSWTRASTQPASAVEQKDSGPRSPGKN